MSGRGRGWAAATCLAALASLTGCGLVFYRGPHGVAGAIERQLGCDLDRRFGLKLGFATAPLASSIVRAMADEEDEAFLQEPHLRQVGVAVFQVQNRRGKERALDARKLGLGDWDTLVRVREDGEQMLLLSKPSRNGGIKDAVVVAYDGDEVVLVRLKGDLDRLIEAAARAAESDRES